MPDGKTAAQPPECITSSGTCARIAELRGILGGLALDRDGQDELARVARVLDAVVCQRKYELLESIALAVGFLKATPPQLAAAHGIRKNVEQTVGGNSLSVKLRRNSPAANVMLGLVTLLVGAPLLIASLLLGLVVVQQYVTSGSWSLNLDWGLVPVVALAGGLGGVVSILARVGQIADDRTTSAFVLYLTGLLKPIIGVAFAVFVYALLAAGLVTVGTLDPGKASPYFYAAIAFVAGFLEKLAPDLIDQVAKRVDPAKATGPSTVQIPAAV
jgi:hypothetical protein